MINKMFIRSLSRTLSHSRGIRSCPLRRGIGGLPSQVVLDANGRDVKHTRGHKAGGCSCSLCSAAKKDNTSKEATPTPGATVRDEKHDLLKATLEKNAQLEEQLREFRRRESQWPHAQPALNMTDEDPDIAQLLKNNQKWVEQQVVGSFFISFFAATSVAFSHTPPSTMTHDSSKTHRFLNELVPPRPLNICMYP